MGVYALYRQAEGIGKDAAGKVAFRAAAAHEYFLYIHAAALFHAFHGHIQLKADALDYGAVNMIAGVVIGKADYGAVGIGLENVRRPVGLEHKSLTAGGDLGGLPVEYLLGGNAKTLRLLPVLIAELLDKPAQHPEAAEHLYLRVPRLVYNRWVRRQECLRFKILFGIHLYGRARSEGYRGLFGACDGETQRLTGFVRARRDERQSLGSAGELCCLLCYVSEHLAGGYELIQLFLRHVIQAAGKVVFLHPALFLIVHGDMGYGVGRRVGKAAGHAVVQISRQADDLFGLFPYLRLLLTHPVDL